MMKTRLVKLWSFLKPRPQDKLKYEPDPFRDWRRALLAFALAFILLVGADLIVYRQLVAASLEGESLTAEDLRQTLDESTLAAALKIIETREVKFQAALKAKPAVVDPS